MVLLRDTEGNFYEVADDVLEGKRVEPPLDDANFRASDYRWDPREDGASDQIRGANVSTIAIEVPITRITSDGKPAATSANPVIGMYANTARQNGLGYGFVTAFMALMTGWMASIVFRKD